MINLSRLIEINNFKQYNFWFNILVYRVELVLILIFLKAIKTGGMSDLT